MLPGVNMVEWFFSILGKRGLSQSVHTSKRQLKQFLLDYIARNSENPMPFVWTIRTEKNFSPSSRPRKNTSDAPAQAEEAPPRLAIL